MGALRSRPLCIFLTVLFLFASFFVLNVSAASDNLIEPDLREWESLESLNELTVLNTGNIYRLTGKGNGFVGVVYDLPSFTAGHSFTLSFRIPSGSDISSAFGSSWSDSNSISYFNNSTVQVGYGFLRPDGSLIDTQVELFEFNSSNISRYIGKDLKTTFVGGTGSGRPVVYIMVNTNDANTHHFFFSDFILFDNDDNSKELTGIRGFLHYIRWELVGGTCEEPDCPHSSNINPHLSLTERMTAGFSSLLDTIGNKFEEGSTLSLWFDDLSFRVRDLGTSVGGSVTGLGDRISDFTDSLKTGIDNNFNGLATDLGLRFDNTVNSIDGFFSNLWSKFDEVFDKFKPRVYEKFIWKRGIVIWNTGEVYYSNEKYPHVFVSEFFEVSPGTKYYVDFIATADTVDFTVYKYDYYGNYIGPCKSVSASFEKYELESGFKYRFRTRYPAGETDLSVINDYVLVYADEGWINALLHQLSHTLLGCVNLVLYLDWDGLYENPFSNGDQPISLISDVLNDISDFVADAGESIEDILDSLTGALELFSRFTERFEWLVGLCVFTLAVIVITRFIGL